MWADRHVSLIGQNELKKKSDSIAMPIPFPIEELERMPEDEKVKLFRSKKTEMAESKKRDERKKLEEQRMKEQQEIEIEQESKHLDRLKYKECVFYNGKIVEGKRDNIIENNLQSGFNLQTDGRSSKNSTAKMRYRDKKQLSKLPPLMVALIDRAEYKPIFSSDEDRKPVAIYDSIELKPGVVYVEKGRSKKPLKSYNEDVERMTKTEYGQKVNGWINISELSLGIPETATNARASINRDSKLIQTARLSQTQSKMVTKGDYGRPLKNTVISKVNNFDIKQLVVAKQLNLEDERRYSLSPNYTKPQPQFSDIAESTKKDDVDNFNIEILKKSDWGYAAAEKGFQTNRKYDRPKTRISRISIGASIKLPRERISIKRYLSRERLPPPSLGFTIGHGQIETKKAD